jgi:hypothetical protein
MKTLLWISLFVVATTVISVLCFFSGRTHGFSTGVYEGRREGGAAAMRTYEAMRKANENQILMVDWPQGVKGRLKIVIEYGNVSITHPEDWQGPKLAFRPLPN